MNQNTTFSYNYSARENKEVQEIRKKYLPCEESKFEQLQRLDGIVQGSGMVESLCTGIIGALVFGLGMCLVMQVIASGTLAVIGGVVCGIAGAGIMLSAYPVYRKLFNKATEKYRTRILELTEELMGENSKS